MSALTKYTKKGGKGDLGTYERAEASNRIFRLINKIKDVEDVQILPDPFLSELRRYLLDDFQRLDKSIFEDAISLARYHLLRGWSEQLAREVLERNIREARKETEEEESKKVAGSTTAKANSSKAQ